MKEHSSFKVAGWKLLPV